MLRRSRSVGRHIWSVPYIFDIQQSLYFQRPNIFGIRSNLTFRDNTAAGWTTARACQTLARRTWTVMASVTTVIKMQMETR